MLNIYLFCRSPDACSDNCQGRCMYTNYCDFMPQAPDGTTWEFYRTYRYPDYERVGHCYRYVSLPKNRQQAREYCAGFGGVLATVPNQYIRNWMRDYLNFPDGIIALGANDEGGFGWEIWGWEDMRTRWSYENWNKDPREPNGGTRENCLAIWPDYYNDNYYHYWYDIPCSQATPFICQTRNCYGMRGDNQKARCPNFTNIGHILLLFDNRRVFNTRFYFEKSVNLLYS